jgi:hypothetical protein
MFRGSPSRLSLVVLPGLLTMLVLAYLAGCGERTPDMDMAMFRAHTESEAVLILCGRQFTQEARDRRCCPGRRHVADQLLPGALLRWLRGLGYAKPLSTFC